MCFTIKNVRIDGEVALIQVGSSLAWYTTNDHKLASLHRILQKYLYFFHNVIWEGIWVKFWLSPLMYPWDPISMHSKLSVTSFLSISLTMSAYLLDLNMCAEFTLVSISIQLGMISSPLVDWQNQEKYKYVTPIGKESVLKLKTLQIRKKLIVHFQGSARSA